jgi:hypothetical protein
MKGGDANQQDKTETNPKFETLNPTTNPKSKFKIQNVPLEWEDGEGFRI